MWERGMYLVKNVALSIMENFCAHKEEEKGKNAQCISLGHE